MQEIVKEREEERERLRKELRRNRERLHAFDVDAQKRDNKLERSTSLTQTTPDNGDNSHTDGAEEINKDVI